MRQGVLYGVACAFLLGAEPACGGDDGGDGAGGGTGGSTGGSSGGGTGGAGGGAGGAGGGAGGAGGSAGASPCTMTWTGAATGTSDCTDSASSKFLGLATAATVSWQVNGETAGHKATFSFHLAKPPTATTYDGTAADDNFCTASITSADFLSVWNVSSKAPKAGASCSITLTSVADVSSGTSSKYAVHGTASATLVKASDASVVTLSVTF